MACNSTSNATAQCAQHAGCMPDFLSTFSRLSYGLSIPRRLALAAALASCFACSRQHSCFSLRCTLTADDDQSPKCASLTWTRSHPVHGRLSLAIRVLQPEAH